MTGKHPFYLPNDNEKSYIERISKDKIDVLLEESFERWEFSDLAKSLIRKLLARGITDRYTVNQALAHPWITRRLDDPIPLTQNESNFQLHLEVKLKGAQQLMLVLAITQHGKQIKRKFNQEKLH